MPTFSQRPLTWLFAIAYACALAASLSHANEQVWQWGGILLVAGVYIVGCSAALSQRHRLTRAALFVGGVTAANLLVIFQNGVRGEAVALISVMAIAPLVASAVTRRLVGLGAICGDSRPAAPWRISIIEILGWMIVVAIGSTTLRFADLASLPDSYEGSLWIHGAAVGVLAGLFLTPERRCDRAATVLSTLITVCALLILPKWTDDWYDNTDHLATIYALVGLWILVLRLDGATAVARTRAPDALALNQPLPDASQNQ